MDVLSNLAGTCKRFTAVQKTRRRLVYDYFTNYYFASFNLF